MGERAAELYVLHPGPARRLMLTGRIAIGARDDCDLRLEEPGVEPLHAVILPLNGAWVLRSTVYILCRVNEKPVVETILADQDVIELGPTRLAFRLVNAAAESLPPVATSLVALRDDVAAERALLAEERTLWEAELERRRAALAQRERSFRDRAARTARAVQRERERVQRRQKRNAQRAAELDKLAGKIERQQKAIDLAKMSLRVDERHTDEKFQQIEERRALVGADADATATRLAGQKKELLRLDLEIERRRKDLERYAAPGAPTKGKTLLEREFEAAAKEREAAVATRELETVFHDVDALLARLERHAAVSGPAPRAQRLIVVAELEAETPDVLPMPPPVAESTTDPEIDLVAWADHLKERVSIQSWWDAREAEFQQAIRQWREERQELLAQLHEKQHAVNAARTALTEREFRVAQEVARERTTLHREREALDRRRVWLDRAQQRYAALQAAALEARLVPMDVGAVSAAEMIAKLKTTDELWQQFRCDVLRERMDLACERERWRIRDQELVGLRRLVLKQRLLLGAIISDQGARDRLWNCERRLREAAALERETAVERLAFALLEEHRPTPSRPAAAPQIARKAA